MDMEAYLSKKQPKAKKKSKEEFEAEAEEYHSKNFLDKVVDFVSGPGEPISEKEELEEDAKELEDYDKHPEGFFDKIKNWFNPPEEEFEEIKSPEVEPEIKEILKIQNKWLLKLPKKTIAEFKASPDYELYKSTLKKYKLIKE